MVALNDGRRMGNLKYDDPDDDDIPTSTSKHLSSSPDHRSKRQLYPSPVSAEVFIRLITGAKLLYYPLVPKAAVNLIATCVRRAKKKRTSATEYSDTIGSLVASR